MVGFNGINISIKVIYNKGRTSSTESRVWHRRRARSSIRIESSARWYCRTRIFTRIFTIIFTRIFTRIPTRISTRIFTRIFTRISTKIFTRIFNCFRIFDENPI